MPSFTQPLPSMQPYDPSYTQPDLSLPHFPRSGQTMPLFPLSDLSMKAPRTSYTRHSPSPSTRRGPNFTEEELAESDEVTTRKKNFNDTHCASLEGRYDTQKSVKEAPVIN
ncbi:hypothetical protein HanIR_Chr09g0447771 [Helianthus annuus]|nr:hypothetical protein HanIR_Chr09g0447771 [Helianthus annuus]